MIKPREYQVEAVKNVLSKWRDGVTRQLISLPTGCHAAGTKILMFDGQLKNVEDVCAGDLLMGPDSKPRTVLSLIRGVDDMYRIEPIKGEPFVVNGEHILSLKNTVHRNPAGKRKPSPSEIAGRIINIPLSDYLLRSKNFKHSYQLYRVPVEFEEKQVTIAPYFLGVLLGDGTISVTKYDEAIRSECYIQAQYYGLRIRKRHREGTKIVSYFFANKEGVHAKKYSNPLRNELIQLGLYRVKSGEKFMPDVYKVNSRSVRLNILAGLIDTDGSLRNGGFEFLSKSKRLADDVVFLSRSLGLAAYMTVKRIADTDYYRVFISGDCSIIPTRIPRKQAPKRKQKKDVLVTGFNVAPVGRGDYYGFQVDSDNLYVMGDFTVTHNCGKTICFGLVAEALREPTLILAHREELLYQAKSKIKLVYPDADIGILKAAKRDGLKAEICVASIQTAARHVEKLKSRGYKLIVCDEAHHAPSPTYKRVFDELGFMNGDRDKLLLGVTATAYRGDSKGLEEVFEEIVFERSILTMIKAGYLCDIRGLEVNTGEDISCVHMRTGDFAVNELSQIIDIPERNNLVADTYLKYGEGRRGVVFGVKVEHAKHLAEAFRERGVPCEAVYGDMPEDERRDILQRYANHELQILTNVGVLTEGWDVPDTDIIMMARPTKSQGLYVQCVGRGLRIAPEKKDCLLIDFVDIAKRHELCKAGTLAGKDIKLNGKSLLDVLNEEERGQYEERERQHEYRAPTYENIDVLGRSQFTWQKRGEHYALSLVNEILYCQKVDGGYRPILSKNGVFTQLSDDILPLDYCSGVCEDYARQLGADRYAVKDAGWRYDFATEKQIKLLRDKGMYVKTGLTKGEASDLLGQVMSVGATEKQIWYITHYGLHSSPELLTKSEAFQLIKQYKERQSRAAS